MSKNRDIYHIEAKHVKTDGLEERSLFDSKKLMDKIDQLSRDLEMLKSSKPTYPAIAGSAIWRTSNYPALFPHPNDWLYDTHYILPFHQEAMRSTDIPIVKDQTHKFIAQKSGVYSVSCLWVTSGDYLDYIHRDATLFLYKNGNYQSTLDFIQLQVEPFNPPSGMSFVNNWALQGFYLVELKMNEYIEFRCKYSAGYSFYSDKVSHYGHATLTYLNHGGKDL